MSTYNNNRFTPGNKGNLRLFMNKEYILQSDKPYLNEYVNYIKEKLICGCIQQQANKLKQGWNDPSQTENTRISQALTGTLGGRITFGNNNKPIILNYLGGYEGQSGGIPKPLRNKF